MNTTLTPQQIQQLTAMGMAPTPTMPTANVSQPAVPFNVVANPNQFQQPYMQQAQPAQPAAQMPQNTAQLSQRIPAQAGIPAAFHGRTIQEVLDGFAKTAGTLQNLQRQQAAQPAAQTAAPQPQQFAPQQFGQAAPVAAPQTPAGMTLEQIQQAIRSAVAEQNLPSLVLQTEQAIASQHPAYGNPEIRGRVQEIIGGLPPEQQAQRGMWDYAMTMAIGEQAQKSNMSGFMQPTQRGDAPFVQGQRPADNYLNGNAPAFVEAPSGTVQYAQGQRPPLTQAEATLAGQLGLDPASLAQHNQRAFGFAS
jgi:hypothetical protein